MGYAGGREGACKEAFPVTLSVQWGMEMCKTPSIF